MTGELRNVRSYSHRVRWRLACSLNGAKGDSGEMVP